MRTQLWTLLFVSSSCLVSAEDWPAFDRDVRRSGVSGERLQLPLGPAWVSASQRPRPAWSEPGRTANLFEFDTAFQPVVAGGLVYFASSADDTLHALDAKDGTVQWTFTTAAPLRFAPQIADGRCFFAGDDGFAYCLDARSGKLVWKFQAAPEHRMLVGNGRMISRWPCRSGVLVQDETVFLTAGMWPAEGTYFYALDARTGRPKWTNDTLNAMYLSYPHDGVSFGGPTPQGHLLSDGKSLVVPTGQSAPAVLDAKTGQLLHWHPQKAGSTWARLGDDFAMVAGRGWQPDQDIRLGEAEIFRGDGIAFYDLATGEVTTDAKWRAYDSLTSSVRYNLERWRGQIAPIGGRDRAVLTGKRLFTSGMGAIEAIDCERTLRRLWQLEHPRVYGLILAGDLLIAGGDGIVSAIDAEKGHVAWRGEIDGQARGLAVANGTLFVSNDRGTLYAFASGRPASPVVRRAPTEDSPRTGFALVVGSANTDVAEKFATSSSLHVICLLESSSVAAARKKLLGRGYGQRIVVHALPADGRLPYADYFANEIVVDGGPAGVHPDELYRVLHPCTGKLRFLNMPPDAVIAFVRQAGISEPISSDGVIRRDRLEGAFDWNSPADVDQRIKWPLELLWFGGPGRERTMARHRQGLPPPIAANGRNFIPGDGFVTAVDAYNGCELWTRFVPHYKHVAADDDRVYIGLSSRVMQCNAQTGRLEKVYGKAEPVVVRLDESRTYSTKSVGAYAGEITVAKSADAVELTFTAKTPQADEKDGWTLWFDFRDGTERLSPSGRGSFPLLVNTTTATLRKFDGFGGSVIPAVEIRRDGEQIWLRIPFDELRRLTGKLPASFDLSAELALYREFDVRLRDRPLTDGRDPWQNGTATFLLSDDQLARVPRGEIASLPAFAKDWGRTPRSVRHDGNIPRPPLATVTRHELKQRDNPLTGETEARDYLRGYGCSGTICSTTMDFFRSGTFGMYDLADDSGMRNFAGVRPGCRITVLPALGVLLSTEGTGDCFCPYNFSTALALAPARERKNEDWGVFVDKTKVTQMRRLALNFGAPGDRRDETGTLWLGYPRQPLMFATGGAIGPRPHAFGLPAAFELLDEGRAYRVNADRTPIEGTANPWVSASAMLGVKRLSLGLLIHEPKTTCLAVPITTPPRVDANLDDAAWSGDPGIGIVTDTKTLAEKGRVRLRADADRLYVAYEQQPKLDRRGATLPWTDAFFDVVLKDVSKAAYAQFSVTARGTKSSGTVNGVVRVPRVREVTIDGKPDDWGQQGLELQLGDGRGSLRLGWTDRGLLVLQRLTARAAEKPGPGLRTQFANLESPAVVETVANAAQHSAELIAAVIGGKSDPDSKPARVVVDEEDPVKKELDSFRTSEPVKSPVASTHTDDEFVIESLLPLDRLGLQPQIGTSLGLQVSAFDPASKDFNIAGGAGARRALFRSGAVLTLSLADSDAAVPPVAALAQKREWFGTLPTFTATSRPVSTDDWSSAVIADDRSFRAEFAIPWRLLESAGLTRDRLVAQFHSPIKLAPNLDLLAQAFHARSVRIHTNPPPLMPTEYLVRLHFCELDDKRPGERVFDIRLQGRTVLENFDIVREADGPRRALAKAFRINPDDAIEIEFVPKAGIPLINGLEIVGDQNARQK